MCERLQCQSLTPAHRGQTNALIRSWHAATTFLPLAPSASRSLPSSFLSSSAFFRSLSLCLSIPHTYRDNTFVPISLRPTAARHAIRVEIARPGCRMKRWGLNRSWLLACWTARESKKGPQPGVNMLHMEHHRSATDFRPGQPGLMLYSIFLGWWLTYKQLRQINIFTHWAPVSFTEMAENIAMCIGAFPSLFHNCESSIRCCRQAHTQTINSANTGSLLVLQQWSHTVWVVVSLKCTALITAACFSLSQNLPLPKPHSLAAAVRLEDLPGLCSLLASCCVL